MQETKQRIEKVSQEFKNIFDSFDFENKEIELKALEAKTTDPDLWQDPEKARKLLQNFADLKKDIDGLKSLQEEIQILEKLIQEESDNLEDEVEKVEKKVKKLRISSFLSNPHDLKNAIVSIHAGQGGTEAMDWTSMLLRMYLKFCEKKGWNTKVLDSNSGEEAGLKSVIFLVKGKYAYGNLKHEAGTHRLVRQSPFNADSLRQTSFSLVEILPEFEDLELPDIEIKEEDIKLQFFRASSHGGQNVQKVSTAVRITHIPTKIVVTAQSERFQVQNRKIAMNLLKSKLWALEQEKISQKKKDIKGKYKPASWGNQIRSYVLHPYKMVKDLRTNVETSDTDSVLDGEIDDFIEAEISML